MAKYHINPKTGDISSCRATIRPCRFGSELHAETPENAAALYEKFHSENTIGKAVKKQTFTNEKIREYKNEVDVLTHAYATADVKALSGQRALQEAKQIGNKELVEITKKVAGDLNRDRIESKKKLDTYLKENRDLKKAVLAQDLEKWEKTQKSLNDWTHKNSFESGHGSSGGSGHGTSASESGGHGNRFSGGGGHGR